jgi:hypothetical protein
LDPPPGNLLVVVGLGDKAPVQDADETVGECPECLMMAVAGGAVTVIERPGSG